MKSMTTTRAGHRSMRGALRSVAALGVASAMLATGMMLVSVAPASATGASPTVSSVSPTYGPTAGGTPVTITGTNFTGATAVDFGTTPVNSIHVVSDTTITTVSPAGAGTQDVTVTIPTYGTSATSAADYFTFGVPTVSALNPATGPTTGGTSVTITGAGFVAGSTVDFGTTPATTVSVVSPTRISAVSPAGAGVANVTVTNASGPSTTSVAFTYGAPTVSGVSPSSGPTTGGTPVTIFGTDFVAGSSVDFGGSAGTSVSVTSPTTITAVSPPGAGVVNVTVRTPSGTSAISVTDQFTYGGAPTITAVSPSSGPTTGGTPVTIYGTDFVAGSSVDFGATPATSASVTSPTTITAVSPPGAGVVNVTVRTPSGTSAITVVDQFHYGVPTVSTINPSSGPTTGGTTVTIFGTGFVAGSSVDFGATPATSVNVASPTTITAVSPAGDGAVDVTVANIFGTSAKFVGDHFTYVALALRPQAALSFTRTTGVLGVPLALTSRGGSGTGALTYSVTNPGSAKCSIRGGQLIAVRAGACNVKVTKASNPPYFAASSPITKFVIKGKSVVSAILRATSVEGVVRPGLTLLVVVVGHGFYNRPSITSNEVGTDAVVTHDTGGLLVVRVSLRPRSALGTYVFKITLANGHSCTVRYQVR